MSQEIRIEKNEWEIDALNKNLHAFREESKESDEKLDCKMCKLGDKLDKMLYAGGIGTLLILFKTQIVAFLN